DLLARLVVAAANNPRRLEIELQEIAPRGEILRPEADGVLELPAHPPGHRQAALPVRLLAVDPSQPAVIFGIVGIELHAALERRDGPGVVAKLEPRPAEPEIRRRVPRRVFDSRLEDVGRFAVAAVIELLPRPIDGVDGRRRRIRNRPRRGGGCQNRNGQHDDELHTFSAHRTSDSTRTRVPSRSSDPPGSATWSLSASPRSTE